LTEHDEWSPDEPLGAEAFEQGDEALDERARMHPDDREDAEEHLSLQVDERELEETGSELDDPEEMVTLDGGIDDPDGLGGPVRGARSRRDDDGWDLDPSASGDDGPGPGSLDEPTDARSRPHRAADRRAMVHDPGIGPMEGSTGGPKGAGMAEDLELDAHHRATVAKIFNHPVGHNIQWHDVLSLLRSVATVTVEPGDRYTVTLGPETQTFAAPRHHDVDEQQVVDLRRMLRGAEITPDSLAHAERAEGTGGGEG
jgi:hypothetical protein